MSEGCWSFTLNKTWSSVSNSSLSKTFALCQFRKQNLCFLPPNIVLGLKKNESKNYLGSEKNLVRKKMKIKKIWVWKNFSWKKMLGLKKILGQKKFWDQKKFWHEKNFGPEIILGQKKFWVKRKIMLWKIFWVWEKILGLKFFLVQLS